MNETTHRGYRIVSEPRHNRDTGRTCWVWAIKHPTDPARSMTAKTVAGAKRIVDAMFRKTNAVTF